jgi:hypothetical protein
LEASECKVVSPVVVNEMQPPSRRDAEEGAEKNFSLIFSAHFSVFSVSRRLHLFVLFSRQ